MGRGADRAGGDVMTRPVFPEDSWVQVRYPLTREQEHGDRDRVAVAARLGGSPMRPR